MNGRNNLVTFTTILLFIFTTPLFTEGKTIYVDDDANGPNEGSSWENAYKFLQDALVDANSSEKPVEIQVAQGIYRPDEGSNQTPGDRMATFQLINGVTLRGGYAGLGQPDPNVRDIRLYKTILSGDLDDSMGELTKETFFDVMVPRYSSTTASYHVVLADSTDSSAVLDGFTITGGVANGTNFDPITDITTYDGGGIYCVQASPTIIDCTIRGNCVVFHAGGPGPMGGGMFSQQGNPTLLRCTFELNAADDYDSDSAGAGLTNYLGSIRLTDCVFAYNRTFTWGGGFQNSGNAALERCRFVANHARVWGGAIYNERGSLTLSNCLFEQNSSAQYPGYPGGCIVNFGRCEVSNCTFVRNTNYALAHSSHHEGDYIMVHNSIFWDGGQEITDTSGTIDVQVSYSDVQGGWPGEHNINADPLFVDLLGGNYRLRSISPCVNTGSNSAVPPGVTTDLDGRPRIIGGIVDMGAYEYQHQKPRIIYVDDSSTGANNGSSWADAYNYLQDALYDANASEKPAEIRVAAGTYKSDQGVGQTTGDRNATFQLLNDVAIKGGYAGFGEANPDARDVRAHTSVLSGDLSKTLPTLTKENFIEVLSNRGVQDYRNSYHVVTGSGTDTTSVLDGFVITGGTANGPAFGEPADAKYFCGGGVYVKSGSPTIVDCVIKGNVAFVYGGPPSKGGGMFNMNSSPVLIRCSFVMNMTYDMDSDAYGAGMMNQDSNPTLTNCMFSRNWGEWGGGMYNTGNRGVTLTCCTFVENWGHYGGGAIYNQLSSSQALTTSNCLFAGNGAGQPGGAVDMQGGSYILSNCTFTGNRAAHYEGGNAISFRYYHLLNSLEAVNCIFRDGGDEVLYNDRSLIQISFSNIEGGWEGQGNIDVDPCFADPNNGDYHLKSQAGRWDATAGRWTKDDVTSLCIDAGDAESPIGLEPFPNGGIINMGAYGGTAEASKSYFGKPVCEIIVAGDINGDCIVDFKDFAIMAYHWLEEHNF